MTSFAESETRVEKNTLVVSLMDHDQAEKGGTQPDRKRTLSMFGTRKHSFLKPQIPAPERIGLMPTARPVGWPRTNSLHSILPPTTGSDHNVQPQIAELRLAASNGDGELANHVMDTLDQDDMLLSAGFTTQDPSGNGLLQMAALYGHIKVMVEFLNRGISINGVDRNHGTALQAAIYMGQKDTIQFLLDWEKSISPIDKKRKGSINDRININTKGGYYGCALQVAAYRANNNLVQQLLQPEYQADVNVVGGKYGSPLQAAVRTGRMDVVGPILDKANVNFKGGKYGSALQAVARGHYRQRTRLPEISRGRILKQFAQLWSGHHVDREENDSGDIDHVEVAKALFEKGARMNGQSGIFGNPINAAACSGSIPMLKLMLKNYEARSPEWTEPEHLVKTKALLTAITQSPENNEALARLLIESGAMIQYETSALLPNLPLEAAATKGLLGLINYLLEIRDSSGHHVDTLAESGIHGTALRAAIAASKPGKEEVPECLITRIAERWGLKERSPSESNESKISSPIGSGLASPTYDPPTTRDAELNWVHWDDAYGNLLQLATIGGLRKTVSLLLKYGANPNVRDTSQRTCLHVAAWFGFPKIVQLLLENDADCKAKDEWGATPLDQAEESLDKQGHPGATEEDLQQIVQLLKDRMGSTDNGRLGMFRGPKKARTVVEKPARNAKPVFSMPFWVPGVGFRATIVDIWEYEEQECLLLKKPRIEDILYHRAVLKSIMDSMEKPASAKNKLRWIHIPTNNMAWAEMVVTSLCRDKNMPAYKGFWGADLYTSADLSPHARFISPQCGRLVQDGSDASIGAQPPELGPLFMAMPYLQWEAYHSQKSVSRMIVDVKNESLKTSPTPNDKLPLWPSERKKSDVAPNFQITDPAGKDISEEPGNPHAEYESLDNPDAEEDYFELLRRYLYKRRPVHLRRTLDQYYYSYLADTNDRDGDQVVMRQYNEDRKLVRLKGDSKYKDLLKAREMLVGDAGNASPGAGPMDSQTESDDLLATASKATTWQWALKKFRESGQKKKLKDVEGKIHKVDQRKYYDDNSPILMVDQLWMWVIDEETIVTSFPHRQYDRDKDDLDAADRTDVLKTVVSYLHTAHRPEINTAQELAELIISQCVGVLHKSDMIPELDFLKNYSVQSNKWADQVMSMLSQFVKDFEEFMTWIKEQPAESEESIRWFESIFSVTEQTRLLRNIQDIIDELEMLKAVFDDQVQVLRGTDEEFEREKAFQCPHGCHAITQGTRCPHSSKPLVDQSLKHLKHVERMQVQANQAYGTLKDLLNLKQQQAYVLEARVSRNEAISSGVQSKTIMVFTIVTIIFLPLTFVTTVFTLPIAEFQRVVLPAGADFPPTAFLSKSYISKYIIGITFAVAVPLILAAFEIQSALNGWKLLRLNMVKRKKEKELGQRKIQDDGLPEFLKGI